MKVKLLGVTLNMNVEELANPDIAKKYEDGIARALIEIVDAGEETVGSEGIRKQGQAVIDTFEDMFGEEDTKKVLGERTNIFRCLDAFDEYVSLYSDVVTPAINERAEKYRRARLNER